MITPRSWCNVKCKEEYLATVVGTVLCKDVVDVWILDGAEYQRLPVVSGPVVQIPHPHSGEIHAMRVQRLQVHVLHHMLVGVKACDVS